MTTRTMGRLMISLGALGWALGIALSMTGRDLEVGSEGIPGHLVLALASTLCLVLVLTWCLVFAIASRRSLGVARPSFPADTRRPFWILVIACGSAFAVTLGNFLVGFLVVTGAVGGGFHLGVVITWLAVVGAALWIASRALSRIEAKSASSPARSGAR